LREVQINESAPVASTVRIETAADRELVWEVLTRIDEWPGWNPDVDSAALEGELGEGSVFRWNVGSRTIVSTIRQVEAPALIAWTGRTSGLRAIHVYRLEARGRGTLVSSAESWEGLVARVFRTRMQGTLERAMEAGLRHLKREAERRTSEG
jgi:uncharacterized protein YndB with AHSA1/START domain